METIIFPSETPDISTLASSDKILIADASDADKVKDCTLDSLRNFLISEGIDDLWDRQPSIATLTPKTANDSIDMGTGSVTAGVLTDGTFSVTGGAIAGATWTGALVLSQNSDMITFSHDGINAYMKWSDGYMIFQPDEGTNTHSYVYSKGKGVGEGQFVCMYGNNVNSYCIIAEAATKSYMDFGSSVTEFVINEIGNNVNFRVEGSTSPNLFNVDAGNNKVWIQSDSNQSYPTGPSTGMFEIWNKYSTEGSLAFYVAADAAGGIITFAANPSFTGGKINGLTSEYGSSSRGAITLESFSGEFNVHQYTQTGGTYHVPFHLTLTGSELVINESGIDMDFRVETNDYTTGFKIDAENNIAEGCVFATQNTHHEIGVYLNPSILTAPRIILGLTGTMVDGSTETDYATGAGRTWTYHNTTSADKITQGNTYVIDMDGTSTYLSTPDAADLSFGDGTNDSPFSIGGWIYLSPTTTYDAWVMKWDSTSGSELREYYLALDTSEKLLVVFYDESANVQCQRLMDSALSVGWHFVVMTYDGGGGVTAADGITIYVDGVVVASTATNSGSYVAMENSNTEVMVGANIGTGGVPQSFYPGDLGRLFLEPSEISAAIIHYLYEATRGFLNV